MLFGLFQAAGLNLCREPHDLAWRASANGAYLGLAWSRYVCKSPGRANRPVTRVIMTLAAEIKKQFRLVE